MFSLSKQTVAAFVLGQSPAFSPSPLPFICILSLFHWTLTFPFPYLGSLGRSLRCVPFGWGNSRGARLVPCEHGRANRVISVFWSCSLRRFSCCILFSCSLLRFSCFYCRFSLFFFSATTGGCTGVMATKIRLCARGVRVAGKHDASFGQHHNAVVWLALVLVEHVV